MRSHRIPRAEEEDDNLALFVKPTDFNAERRSHLTPEVGETSKLGHVQKFELFAFG